MTTDHPYKECEIQHAGTHLSDGSLSKEKQIADKITLESGWDTRGDFDSVEVSKLITHIVATFTRFSTAEKSNEFKGIKNINSIAKIWREISANLEYGLDPEGS